MILIPQSEHTLVDLIKHQEEFINCLQEIKVTTKAKPQFKMKG